MFFIYLNLSICLLLFIKYITLRAESNRDEVLAHNSL